MQIVILITYCSLSDFFNIPAQSYRKTHQAWLHMLLSDVPHPKFKTWVSVTKGMDYCHQKRKRIKENGHKSNLSCVCVALTVVQMATKNFMQGLSIEPFTAFTQTKIGDAQAQCERGVRSAFHPVSYARYLPVWEILDGSVSNQKSS